MTSPRAPDFAALIARLSDGLSGAGLPFMLIGGQAVLLHGQPRLTDDIDITLGAGPSALSTVLEVCTALALRPLPSDVDRFVRETFVLPVRDDDTGVRVDFVFSTTPYERQAIERAVRVTLNGIGVPFAAVEDLIIHKLFAGRAHDLDDAIGVVRRKGAEIDWQYVERWASEFSNVPGREDLPRRVATLRAQAHE